MKEAFWSKTLWTSPADFHRSERLESSHGRFFFFHVINSFEELCSCKWIDLGLSEVAIDCHSRWV